jgi:hypothetical protein
LVDAPVITIDGDEKCVRNFLFDDQSWSIRFLVIDLGSWLTRRLVVVSTAAVDEPDWARKAVAAHLTKEQLLKSPDVDSQKPVSRQQQLALREHFGWPDHASDCFIPSTLVPEQREFPVRTQDDLRMVGYTRNPDLRGRDYLVPHYCTPLVFCRIPGRDNPVWSRVASRCSAALRVSNWGPFRNGQ